MSVKDDNRLAVPLCAGRSDDEGVIVRPLVSVLLLSVLLSTVPLPFSEEGQATIPPGGTWSYPMELVTRAHVTCIVRSNMPVDATLSVGSSPPDGPGAFLNAVNGTTLYRSTEDLGGGSYILVVRNPGQQEATIDYQVHQDFIVVANMTAKNVMGLSLALSIGIVALFLYSRPRRAQ